MLRRVRLKRNAKLTAKTKLRARSERSRPVERWRAQEANAVHARIRCQVPGCGEPGTDAHHPFGRSPEPWCSSRLVVVLLCRRHHAAVTGVVGVGLDGELRRDLRMLAVRQVQLYVDERIRMRSPRLRVRWENENEVIATAFLRAIEVANLYGIEPPYFGSDRRKK